MNAETETSRPQLAAKPPVSFLLVVWGKKYIEQFVKISLPSLLAPGNIPAMAEKYDCTFVILTQEKDSAFFAKNPLLKRLERYCAVRFADISDLIFSGNYSATITLAYERGMRLSGGRLCDTYFIYLVSDYIMADGSLRNLSRHMQQGYSGITAGNFQIIEEKCEKTLPKMIDAKTGTLSIPPRQLMAFGLSNLHPMTVANTASQNICHSLHSNRLFWRVDKHTMVGRFYLRHMICIRPEIDNYVIGSSCDYSFIEEMCPSGNVFHISDSDDYCVLELQPSGHEQNFIRRGPLKEHALVDCLNEWATAQHRANAHMPVVFHSEELPEKLDEILKQSHDFIARIETSLGPPAPCRGHYYWTSCIAAIYEQILQRNNQEDYYRDGVFAGVHGSKTFGAPVFGKAQTPHDMDYPLLSAHYFRPQVSRLHHGWEKLSCMLAGRPPKVYPWHRSWHDYRRLLDFIRPALAHAPCLYISGSRRHLADWLYINRKDRLIFQKLELFLARPVARLQSSLGTIKSVIIHIQDYQMDSLNLLIPRCLELMPDGGSIYVLCHHEKKPRFKDFFAARLPICFDERIEIGFLRYNTHPFRRYVDAVLERTLISMPGRKRSPLRLLVAFARLFVIGGIYMLGNLLALLDIGQCFPSSSAMVRLDVAPACALPGPLAIRTHEAPYHPKQQAIG